MVWGGPGQGRGGRAHLRFIFSARGRSIKPQGVPCTAAGPAPGSTHAPGSRTRCRLLLGGPITRGQTSLKETNTSNAHLQEGREGDELPAPRPQPQGHALTRTPHHRQRPRLVAPCHVRARLRPARPVTVAAATAATAVVAGATAAAAVVAVCDGWGVPQRGLHITRPHLCVFCLCVCVCMTTRVCSKYWDVRGPRSSTLAAALHTSTLEKPLGRRCCVHSTHGDRVCPSWDNSAYINGCGQGTTHAVQPAVQSAVQSAVRTVTSSVGGVRSCTRNLRRARSQLVPCGMSEGVHQNSVSTYAP